jgi:hypothetical protein
LTTLLTLTGCTAAEVDCGSGSALQTDLGRYCAYGVIVGGFTCPAALPFAFDIEIPDERFSVVCTDSESGEMPAELCEDLGAPADCTGIPAPVQEDGGLRPPLPFSAPTCAPSFPEPTPGSLGGIEVGQPGAAPGTPLDVIADGDTVTVHRDRDGNPALAFALQIGTESSSFRCYRLSVRNTFVSSGTVIDTAPQQLLAETNGRLSVVHDLLGAQSMPLDGEEVELEIAVQDFEVEERRTVRVVLSDP